MINVLYYDNKCNGKDNAIFISQCAVVVFYVICMVQTCDVSSEGNNLQKDLDFCFEHQLCVITDYENMPAMAVSC